jgi:DNA-binding IclR family transcriptional regulator
VELANRLPKARSRPSRQARVIEKHPARCGQRNAARLAYRIGVVEAALTAPTELAWRSCRVSRSPESVRRTSSELFRTLNALCRRGYIGQDGDRYSLTLKPFELAHRHKPIKSLTAAAAPLMRELVKRSLQSCHLTVFHAGRVMVVAEIDSPERWAFGLKVGAQVGLTDTASGYVLLAFQDEAGRRAMIASHQEVEGELTSIKRSC